MRVLDAQVRCQVLVHQLNIRAFEALLQIASMRLVIQHGLYECQIVQFVAKCVTKELPEKRRKNKEYALHAH
jgi:hypothetical protein